MIFYQEGRYFRWGLTVAAPGTTPSNDRSAIALEDGAWVWAEQQGAGLLVGVEHFANCAQQFVAAIRLLHEFYALAHNEIRVSPA